MAVQLGRHLSLGAAAPDVADLRRLQEQAEQHVRSLASTSMIAALEGAQPDDVAQAHARAKEDFSRLKLNLLEQETKKRVLEALLSGGMAPPPGAEALAENQMLERKAAAKRAKGESKELVEKLVEHARSIAKAKRALQEEGAAALALVSSRETDAQREVTSKVRVLEHENTIERLELERKSEEAAAELAEAELERLRDQAEREEATRAQLVERVERMRDEVRKAEQQLHAAMEQQANASQASADASMCVAPPPPRVRPPAAKPCALRIRLLCRRSQRASRPPARMHRAQARPRYGLDRGAWRRAPAGMGRLLRALGGPKWRARQRRRQRALARAERAQGGALCRGGCHLARRAHAQGLLRRERRAAWAGGGEAPAIPPRPHTRASLALALRRCLRAALWLGSPDSTRAVPRARTPPHAHHSVAKRAFTCSACSASAQLSPPSVRIDDLYAVALAANALPVFVRELMARLTSGQAGPVDTPQAELPTRKRARAPDADVAAEEAPGERVVAMEASAAIKHASAAIKHALPLAEAPPAAPSPAVVPPTASPAPGPAAALHQPPAPVASPAGVARAAAAVIDSMLPVEAAAQPQPHAIPAAAPPPPVQPSPPAAAASSAAQPAAAQPVAAQPAATANGAATPGAGGAPAIGEAPRRKSSARKSFSRKSLDASELKRALGPAHSPCGRAEKAGAAANPKAAILGLQGEEAVKTELSLFSTDGRLHARVLSDGSVLLADGSVLAYIEADGSVGSASMDYLGEVNSSTGWISDADEVPVAMLDLGRVAVKVCPTHCPAAILRLGIGPLCCSPAHSAPPSRELSRSALARVLRPAHGHRSLLLALSRCLTQPMNGVPATCARRTRAAQRSPSSSRLALSKATAAWHAAASRGSPTRTCIWRLPLSLSSAPTSCAASESAGCSVVGAFVIRIQL